MMMMSGAPRTLTIISMSAMKPTFRIREPSHRSQLFKCDTLLASLLDRSGEWIFPEQRDDFHYREPSRLWRQLRYRSQQRDFLEIIFSPANKVNTVSIAVSRLSMDRTRKTMRE